jgi:hypothetical protein
VEGVLVLVAVPVGVFVDVPVGVAESVVDAVLLDVGVLVPVLEGVILAVLLGVDVDENEIVLLAVGLLLDVAQVAATQQIGAEKVPIGHAGEAQAPQQAVAVHPFLAQGPTHA